jgi:hypothetical protein
MKYSDNLIFLALFIALAIRVAMHFVDKSRIKDEIAAHGGQVLSIVEPFRSRLVFRKGNVITPSPTAIAQARRFRRLQNRVFGIYWRKPGPRVAPRIISRHRCSACGFAFDND